MFYQQDKKALWSSERKKWTKESRTKVLRGQAMPKYFRPLST